MRCARQQQPWLCHWQIRITSSAWSVIPWLKAVQQLWQRNHRTRWSIWASGCCSTCTACNFVVYAQCTLTIAEVPELFRQANVKDIQDQLRQEQEAAAKAEELQQVMQVAWRCIRAHMSPQSPEVSQHELTVTLHYRLKRQLQQRHRSSSRQKNKQLWTR